MNLETLRTLPSAIQYSQEVSDSLQAFAIESSSAAPAELPTVIKQIAITGLNCYPWIAVRAAVIFQIENLLSTFQSIEEENIEADALQKRKTILFNGINVFEEAPFTLQRICEILDTNGKGFSSVDKLLNALEKLTRVNTVQPSLSPRSFAQSLTEATARMVEQKEKQNEDLAKQKEVEAQKRDIDPDLMEID